MYDAFSTNAPSISSWVVHDIRRSVATGMADIGIPPHIIEQILTVETATRVAFVSIIAASYAAEKATSLVR